MSLNKVGFGTMVFGSTLTGVYSAEAGYDWDGIAREAVDVTSTVDANVKRVGGVLRDYGNISVELFVDPEIDYDDFVDDADTLTWELPISNGTNTTAMSITDDAEIISFKLKAEKDKPLMADVTFMLRGTSFAMTPESA